jgi:hypothetical protein
METGIDMNLSLESQNEKYKNKFYTSENDSFGVKTAHVNF